MTDPVLLAAQALASPETFTPNLNTIVDSFAALAALYLIKVVLEMRDALFGGKKGVGLVAHFREMAAQLSTHCTDEREFWDEVRDGREAIADRAQQAISVSEDRLREDFGPRIDEIDRKLDTLMTQRRHSR